MKICTFVFAQPFSVFGNNIIFTSQTNKKNLGEFFFFFLHPYLWCMEVPGPKVELELQLPDYPRAIATPFLSHICKLHCSLGQYWIFNPRNETRDQTCILRHCQVLNSLSQMGTLFFFFFILSFLATLWHTEFQARDQIQATAATYATVAAMPNP